MKYRKGICISKSKKSLAKGNFSLDKFCEQLKLLYDLLEKRKQEILSDPNFNPNNSSLNDELEKIYKRQELLKDCLNEFCV